MKGNTYYRPCRVIEPYRDDIYDAIFHRFEKLSEMRQYEGGDGEMHTSIVSRMIAIVEDCEGCVMVVEPEWIQFTDSFAERIVNRHRGGDPDDG